MDTPPTADTRFYLSSSDVDRLMHDQSPDARLAVMHKVAEHYRIQDFSDHELATAEQIFRLMMKDVEVEVRKQLADQVKDMDNVPRDIVMHLAQDEAAVALPVIRMSQVLSDADLVYLVQTSREVAKLEAAAERPKVSERVADALVEAKYPNVVEKLVANPGARLSNSTLETVVRDFARESGIMETLAKREALPLPIVEKLVGATSTRIAGELKQKYQIEDGAIEKVAQKAREGATLAMLEGSASDEAIDELVGEMLSQQRLTPSIVFTALARGQVTFFASALSRYAHIPLANARQLIMDKGQFGFKAIYGKSGLPESMFEAAKVVLRHVMLLRDKGEKAGTRAYANHLVQRILSDKSAQEVENMAYMLALIRQNVK